jgi:hypothetical protein
VQFLCEREQKVLDADELAQIRAWVGVQAVEDGG